MTITPYCTNKYKHAHRNIHAHMETGLDTRDTTIFIN